jgi:SAM-dependent methyltransferase
VDEATWATRGASFGSEAENYAYGRPSYPTDAVRWVLPDGASTVLDLAAGTGKLSERLVELGLDVVAVEPLDEMRALIRGDVRALAGRAEAIPLPDASVDAVVVGQAFHWFAPRPALDEIARVLRPGGTLGLLWNLDDDRVDWVAAVCDVTGSEARATAIPADARPPYADDPVLSTPERRLFDHAETYDADRVVAMVASQSRTILLDERDRTRTLDAVRSAAPLGTFAYPSVCEAWRGYRR